MNQARSINHNESMTEYHLSSFVVVVSVRWEKRRYFAEPMQSNEIK